MTIPILSCLFVVKVHVIAFHFVENNKYMYVKDPSRHIMAVSLYLGD